MHSSRVGCGYELFIHTFLLKVKVLLLPYQGAMIKLLVRGVS